MSVPAVVRFARLASNPDLPLPERATPHAAGYDVRSAEERVTLQPGEIRQRDLRQRGAVRTAAAPGNQEHDAQGDGGAGMDHVVAKILRGRGGRLQPASPAPRGAGKRASPPVRPGRCGGNPERPKT